MRRAWRTLIWVAAAGCTFDPRAPLPTLLDAGPEDAAQLPSDTGVSGGKDSGTFDAEGSDGSPADVGGQMDAAALDADSIDAKPIDSGVPAPAIVPSNDIPGSALEEGTGIVDTSAAGALIFSSDDGRIRSGTGDLRPAGTGVDPASGIGFSVVPQSNGAEPIGVFTMRALNVAANTAVRVVGANAVAIVAGGEIVIDGMVTVSGGANACHPGSARTGAACAGPGGHEGAAPCQPCCSSCTNQWGDCSSSCPSVCRCLACAPARLGDGGGGSAGAGRCYPEGGGGGGGHGTPGGQGGTADGSVSAGSNAPVVAGGVGGGAWGAAELVPLTGGGAGGGGGSDPEYSTQGGLGGGGGGALQLVSGVRIVLGAAPGTTCGLRAAGAGGSGPGRSSGGSGGGAGGGLLLEAPEVVLGAGCAVATNGGGGSGSNSGGSGDSGGAGTIPAAGGDHGGGLCGSGDGAIGAAGVNPAFDADSCPLPGNTACGRPDRTCDEVGGGGGGVGIIRINSTSPPMMNGVASPVPTFGSLVVR